MSGIDLITDAVVASYHEGVYRDQLSLRPLEHGETVVAFTGHRPPKLGQAWNGRSTADSAIQAHMAQQLTDISPDAVITGGALGIDTTAARVAWRLGLGYVVYVPFEGQESRWPRARQDAYHRMLALADEVHFISPPGYSREKMAIRNRAMRRDSTLVLAYTEGGPGGTANMIAHCKEMDHPIRIFGPRDLFSG